MALFKLLFLLPDIVCIFIIIRLFRVRFVEEGEEVFAIQLLNTEEVGAAVQHLGNLSILKYLADFDTR